MNPAHNVHDNLNNITWSADGLQVSSDDDTVQNSEPDEEVEVSYSAEASSDGDNASNVLEVNSLSTPAKALLERQDSILNSRRHVCLPGFPGRYVTTQKAKLLPRKKESRMYTNGLSSQEMIQIDWSEEVKLLKRMKPNFSMSDEAKMVSSETIRNGIIPYARLPLSNFNTADIKRAYDVNYDPRIEDGASRGSYIQFLAAIGQFARLRVMLGKTTLESFCEPEVLYLQATDLEIVKTF